MYYRQMRQDETEWDTFWMFDFTEQEENDQLGFLS